MREATPIKAFVETFHEIQSVIWLLIFKEVLFMIILVVFIMLNLVFVCMDN